MDHFNFNVRTRITLRHFDGQGRLLGTQAGHNDFTYKASDIFLTALLRSGPSQITHLYCRFGQDITTSGSPSSYPAILSNTVSDLKAVTRQDFLTNLGGSDPRGTIWVPLVLPPSVQTTDAVYSGNEVTFPFRLPGTLPSGQMAGATFNPSGQPLSFIGAIGLAVAPNYENNRSQDLIFSVTEYTNFNPAHMFQVPADGQTEVSYTFALTS